MRTVLTLGKGNNRQIPGAAPGLIDIVPLLLERGTSLSDLRVCRHARRNRLPVWPETSWRARPPSRTSKGRPGALTVTRHGHGCRAAGLERRLQAVAGGRVTESSGGMPWYGSISTRASWPVQPWLRVEEGRSAVSTLGLP